MRFDTAMSFTLCSQAETLLLVHPYISRLTLSEIHTLMTVGLAGISGTMLAAYISLGVRSWMLSGLSECQHLCLGQE